MQIVNGAKITAGKSSAIQRGLPIFSSSLAIVSHVKGASTTIEAIMQTVTEITRRRLVSGFSVRRMNHLVVDISPCKIDMTVAIRARSATIGLVSQAEIELCA
jgi:hypothetical protein